MDRGGLCWGRHEADPDRQWWAVYEAIGISCVQPLESIPAKGPSVRSIAFEQHDFVCDGRQMGIFLGPGVDVKQVERELQKIQDGLREAASAR